MTAGPLFRKLLAALVLSALALPIGVCLVLGLGRLLAAMGDAAGARVLDRLALAGGLVWALVLITMVILQGALLLDEPRSRREDVPRDELDGE